MLDDVERCESAVAPRLRHGTRKIRHRFCDVENHERIVIVGEISASRSFVASTDGVVTISLDQIAPATVSSLGVGIGIPKNDGAGCELTTAVIASPGTQFTASVDAGKYCVKIFDPGTLTDTAVFTLRLIHP